MILLANIVSFAAGVFSIISVWQKNKSKLLIYQIIEPILTGISDFLLQAYSGVVCNAVAVIRNILCKFSIDKKIISFYMILFYIGYILFFIKDIISFIPLIASLIYTIIIVMSENVNKIRIGVIINNSLWIIYDLIFQNYFSALRDFVLVLNAILTLVKKDI